MHARTDLLQQVGMTLPRRRRETVLGGTAIGSGCAAEAPAEGACEHFVTAKTAGERD